VTLRSTCLVGPSLRTTARCGLAPHVCRSRNKSPTPSTATLMMLPTYPRLLGSSAQKTMSPTTAMGMALVWPVARTTGRHAPAMHAPPGHARPHARQQSCGRRALEGHRPRHASVADLAYWKRSRWCRVKDYDIVGPVDEGRQTVTIGCHEEWTDHEWGPSSARIRSAQARHTRKATTWINLRTSTTKSHRRSETQRPFSL
jgi:hypothetical protein